VDDAPLSRILTPDEVAEYASGSSESLPLAPRVGLGGEPATAAGGEEHSAGHHPAGARVEAQEGRPVREPEPRSSAAGS
jgi:hypothetical protein